MTRDKRKQLLFSNRKATIPGMKQSIWEEVKRLPPWQLSVAAGLATVCLGLVVVLIAINLPPASAAKVAKVKTKSKVSIGAKEHPLDAAITAATLDHVPDLIAFEGAIEVVGNRATAADWFRLNKDERVAVARYLAVRLHPKDSPYAHGFRTVWYFMSLEEVCVRSEVQHLQLASICAANDDSFADYLASQAAAPRK